MKVSTGIWVLQGSASIPLLNGVNYAQIKAAKAGYAAVYFNYIQTVRAVFSDVDNTLTNFQKMTAIDTEKYAALHASEKNYGFMWARYKEGSKDYRDVLNARVSLDYARRDWVIARMQQLDSIVQVYQALAGGYEGAVC